MAELTDMIVDTVEPKVWADRHRQKLTACAPPWPTCASRPHAAAARAAGARGMEQRPRLNAFFASADDIPAFLPRDLRAFFEDSAHAGVDEAWALLGMRRDEKTVLLAPASRAA